MRRKAIAIGVLLFLYFTFFGSIGSVLSASQPETPVDKSYFSSLSLAQFIPPIYPNFLTILILALAGDTTTTTADEKEEKPKTEKPVRLILTIRLSEKD